MNDDATVEPTNPDAGGTAAEEGESLHQQGGDSPTPQDVDKKDPEGQEGTEGQEKPQDQKQNPEGLRKRFRELTTKTKDALSEAERLRIENEALTRALADKGGKPAEATPAPQEDPEPKEGDFQNYQEFEAAHRRWEARKIADERVEKRLAKERETAEARERESRAAEQHARLEREAEAIFEKGTTKYGQEFEKTFLPVEQGGPPLSEVMRDSIMGEDDAADVLMYLVKKPEEGRRIAQLPPLKQAVEMGRLRALIESGAKKPQITNAPATPSPVGDRSPASKDDSKLSDEEWFQKRLGKK